MKHAWSVNFVPVAAEKAVCGWFSGVPKHGYRFLFYPAETA